MADNRSALEIISWLLDEELVPSFCTACYRQGRTGDRFMALAKSGNIKYVCQPNALMTLYEYMLYYGDQQLAAKAEAKIAHELTRIDNPRISTLVSKNLARMKNGERDLYL